jgi:hypothetical protein
MNTQQRNNAKKPSDLMLMIGAAFLPSQEEKSRQLLTYEAQVIDRIMHRKYVPFDIARSMVTEFAGTVKWGHLFGNSPEMIAAQIYDRARHGIEDIDF